jgi:transposase
LLTEEGAMKQTRRQFSPELKREAVRQLEAGQRLADVARALGVHAQVVRRWRDQVRVDPATAFPGNGRPLGRGGRAPAAGRREVTQLRAERDFLKKVAAFFAKDAP